MPVWGGSKRWWTRPNEARRGACVVCLTSLLALASCGPHRPPAPPPLADGPEPPVVYVGAQALHPQVHAITLLPGERMTVLRLPIYAGRIVPPAAVTRRRDDAFTLVVAEGTRITATAGTLLWTKRTHRTTAYVAAMRPGTYTMRLRPKDKAPVEIAILVLTPFDAKRDGALAGYRIGEYPEELGMVSALPARRTMRGFVEVTHANADVAVSAHFRLQDLVCKQQAEHDPKYLMLDVRLLDKLEHLVDRLHAAGYPVHGLTVMSGYRTPLYNREVGNETVWSQHTVGDAADVFVDEDHDGRMDDLDHDGRVTLDDALLLLRIVEDLDDDPRLAGGASAYPATPAHGPFVHVDARGYRARW